MSSRMEDATALWRFSLAFYSRPGVPEVLIGLQDELGIDVNLVLFVLWLASEGRLIEAEDMERVGRTSQGWQKAVVAPLREIRRALKTEPPLVAPAAAEVFRSKIKAAELEAEHLQQDALYALAEGMADSANVPSEDAARRNLATYAHFAGTSLQRLANEKLLTELRQIKV